MKRKSLFKTFFFTISLLLTSCGLSPSNNGDANKLQLLYFGKPTDDNVQMRSNLLEQPHRLDGEPADRNYNIYFDEFINLEAHVKNVDRLAFLDIVVFSASTGKKYVFNDGNGDYRVESTTVLSNDVWTTKLRFSWIDWALISKETSGCFFDTYLEIEEINFLTINGAVTRTNIASSDVKRVNFHAVDPTEENHSWSDYEYVPPTCEDWGKNVRHCTLCNMEQSYEQTRPLGHQCPGYEIQNSTPGVLKQGDLIVSTGECTRCQKNVSLRLPDFNSPIDLVIPDTITTIEEYAFAGSALLSVVIPSSVTSIGQGAFSSCYNLLEVHFESEVPPQIGSDVFGGTWDSDDFRIYVPCGYKDAYKSVRASYWQEYAVRRIVDGHSYGEWVVTKNANGCSEPGERERICSRCGYKESEEIVIEHAWTSWVKNEAKSRHERTCTSCGKVQTRVMGITSAVNSDNKTVSFHYDQASGLMDYQSIKVRDGIFVTGSMDSNGKMDKKTDVKWHIPVYDNETVSIQLPMKMSLSSHIQQSFNPSCYTIKVGGITQTILMPSGYDYQGIGLSVDEYQHYTFAKYTITDADIAKGEIEIEFLHNVDSYRLLFDSDLRLVY